MPKLTKENPSAAREILNKKGTSVRIAIFSDVSGELIKFVDELFK
jgi:hypothetical protein